MLEAYNNIFFCYSSLNHFFRNIDVRIIGLYPNFAVGFQIEMIDDCITESASFPTQTHQLVMPPFFISNNLVVNIFQIDWLIGSMLLNNTHDNASVLL